MKKKKTQRYCTHVYNVEKKKPSTKYIEAKQKKKKNRYTWIDIKKKKSFHKVHQRRTEKKKTDTRGYLYIYI